MELLVAKGCGQRGSGQTDTTSCPPSLRHKVAHLCHMVGKIWFRPSHLFYRWEYWGSVREKLELSGPYLRPSAHSLLNSVTCPALPFYSLWCSSAICHTLSGAADLCVCVCVCVHITSSQLGYKLSTQSLCHVLFLFLKPFTLASTMAWTFLQI